MVIFFKRSYIPKFHIRCQKSWINGRFMTLLSCRSQGIAGVIPDCQKDEGNLILDSASPYVSTGGGISVPALLVYLSLWHTCPVGIHFLVAYLSWRLTFPGGLDVLVAYISWRLKFPGGLDVLVAYISWWHTFPGGLDVLVAYISWWHTFPGGLHILVAYMSWWFTCPGAIHFLIVYPVLHGLPVLCWPHRWKGWPPSPKPVH